MMFDEKNEQMNFEAKLLTQKQATNIPLAHPIIISKCYDESINSQEVVSMKYMLQNNFK
jgi:hypothetical protein